MKRRRARGDDELAEMIRAPRSDRIADRFENRYTDTHVRQVEEKKAPWLKRRRSLP